MRIIKYYLGIQINTGTEDKPVYEKGVSYIEMPWSEVNEQIAADEAYNGEYTIEDDGQPEPGATLETRVQALETDSGEMKEALELILTGVTE